MDGLSFNSKKLKGKSILKRRNITSSGSQSMGQGLPGGSHNLFKGLMRSTLFHDNTNIICLKKVKELFKASMNLLVA